MKSIMVLLDGMQDVTYPQLGGKTPQQAGAGAAFAQLESESARARLISSVPGKDTDTVICTLTLLGFPAERIPTGRTGLEGLAEGVTVGERDLILRCSFVRLDEEDRIADPCCTPPPEIAEALMQGVARRHGCTLKRIGGYKCLQTIPGARESFVGLHTNPAHNCTGRPIAQVIPSGNRLAEELAATTLALLEEHRPYTVLNWAPSIHEVIPTFRQLWGLSGGMVTKTLALEGIAQAMEMPCPAIPGTTGDTDTNLAGKAEATLALLRDNDFVLLHVGGTDEATHRQDPVEKAEFIARIDRELLLPVLRDCPAGTRVMVTCDHAALCSTAGHTDEPVEALLWEKGKAHSGDLGTLPGTAAVELLRGEAW